MGGKQTACQSERVPAGNRSSTARSRHQAEFLGNLAERRPPSRGTLRGEQLEISHRYEFPEQRAPRIRSLAGGSETGRYRRYSARTPCRSGRLAVVAWGTTLPCAASAIGVEAARAGRDGRRRASPVCADDFSTDMQSSLDAGFHSTVVVRRSGRAASHAANSLSCRKRR